MTKTPEELTADWKAKKLKDGAYYIQTDMDITIAFFKKTFNAQKIQKLKGFVPKDRLKKVLSPVPTYDEYKAMQTELAEHRENCCCLENEKLRLDKAKLEMKNNTLRGLLRECLAHLSLGEIGTSVTPVNILLTHINAALGESEEQ